MMSVYCIGIDPGLTGAIAILRDGKYHSLFDMPTTAKGGSGSVKYEVSPAALRTIFHVNIPADAAYKAIIERVNSRPGQAASATFSLGDSFGTARAALACSGIAYLDVTPVTWKKFYGLGSDKEQSRALASKLFPEAELHLKKHHDRSEALLMANYLYNKEYK
jgi:crossover junction endodeoxyribonuclease RuvC